MSSDIQRFKVIIVEGGRFLKKAQILRGKVFFGKPQIDEDKFDEFCKHVVVIERETNNVAGTYRLLLGSRADKTAGFYSETKFDISNIKKNCRGELLEMGRACVDEAYRRYPIINLMWKKIISYIEDKDVKYILGCASIKHLSPQEVAGVLRFFKDGYFSPPELRIYPLKDKVYPYNKNLKDDKQRDVKELLPSLVRSYLKMGALVCGEPAWNKTLDTAVFFMLLNTEKINTIFKNRFL